MNATLRAEQLKIWAKNEGFLQCGIAKSEFLNTEAKRLEQWLGRGFHGEMKWLENHFDMRVDPSKLVPGAKSVISLAYNYFPDKSQDKSVPQIAKYAYGQDYHKVVKKKLKALVGKMKAEWGDFDFRIFVDSGPVMERVWAEKSGLGWVGKHGLLIAKEQGSFFFLAEIICDIDLDCDNPYSKDYCGSCTACVDACPTQAILPNKTLNAQACISYLTIELKNAIPESYSSHLENWIFGCDICQDVCPWNRFSKPHNEQAFVPKEGALHLSEKDWIEITEDVFTALFPGSPLKRAGLTKLKNTLFDLKKQGVVKT